MRHHFHQRITMMLLQLEFGAAFRLQYSGHCLLRTSPLILAHYRTNFEQGYSGRCMHLSPTSILRMVGLNPPSFLLVLSFLMLSILMSSNKCVSACSRSFASTKALRIHQRSCKLFLFEDPILLELQTQYNEQVANTTAHTHAEACTLYVSSLQTASSSPRSKMTPMLTQF